MKIGCSGEGREHPKVERVDPGKDIRRAQEETRMLAVSLR
jgi:hypothetical protein